MDKQKKKKIAMENNIYTFNKIKSEACQNIYFNSDSYIEDYIIHKGNFINREIPTILIRIKVSKYCDRFIQFSQFTEEGRNIAILRVFNRIKEREKIREIIIKENKFFIIFPSIQYNGHGECQPVFIKFDGYRGKTQAENLYFAIREKQEKRMENR